MVPMKCHLTVFLFLQFFFSLTSFSQEFNYNNDYSHYERVPGELVLKLKNSSIKTIHSQMNSILLKYPLKLKRIIPNSDIVIVIAKNPNSKHLNGFANQLIQSNQVVYAEPNYIYKINKLPNDQEYSKQWGLSNTGANATLPRGIAGFDISAEKAWEIETGDENLVVGIIDTGINYLHEDLKENIWKNSGEMGFDSEGKNKETNGLDDDQNGYIDDINGFNFVSKNNDPIDDNGHGTHCAGIIGARGNNQIGISGIAWNIKLMALKFISSSGRGTLEDAIEAITYASKMGAKITNNSWGGHPYSEILKSVIQDANKKGILFVAAAGNEASNNDKKPLYPAGYDLPNIISVAAMSNYGAPATFTNNGIKSVHVVAPGVEILSTYPLDSTTGYKKMSGTSMAAPHVTGISALLLSHFPSMTPVEIRERLITTSQKSKYLRFTSVSEGFVNAYRALAEPL